MNQTHHNKISDLLGVGIGPFNLSVAALLSTTEAISSIFFDENEEFVWHPGMLFSHAEIQVSYLNDLVTLVDPTNPYSFIAYLAKHKRLYRFINAQFKNILRTEFSHYLNWVSNSLPNLFFKEQVEDISFNQSHFVMSTNRRTIRGKHLLLGNGLQAKIPTCVKNYMDKTVVHNKDFLLKPMHWQGKRVAIVGGGQSGAEIVHHILSQENQLPLELNWISRRSQLLPMDTSSFVNEFFTPNYMEYFFHLPKKEKTVLLQEQLLASDGISFHLLKAIYQKLYSLEFLENKGRFFNFWPRHELIHMNREADGHQLLLRDLSTMERKYIPADIVILCTGYQWSFPSYLSALADKIPLENGRFCVNQDFSILWDGPRQNRIYVQNSAAQSHGIAEPNLSVMAWRSAKIINSIAQLPIYDLENESTVLDWGRKLSHNHEEQKYVSMA
ncbi:L-lysine N6-monooxygenase [Legionella sainthelensi]|uniref:L-lysine N6-monooxygenase n=1 Tax=Legionella sainthelensi TaxID=28087 RepID=A0A0W0YNX0_9GAMM|nr:SidA/IucD/PvdA family monooxygenase [Legionella sainthelensi]KTD58561.1 L-lysine N6-monooxygenase [Legionella sainthelensi]VEH27785.1 L-lysine 6-monooxygenase [Legionella sainthelensi]